MRAQSQKGQGKHRRMKRPDRQGGETAQEPAQLLRRRIRVRHSTPRVEQAQQDQQPQSDLPVQHLRHGINGAEQEQGQGGWAEKMHGKLSNMVRRRQRKNLGAHTRSYQLEALVKEIFEKEAGMV